MYRVVGDGSYKNTKVYQGKEEIDYTACHIGITKNGCKAVVNGTIDDIDIVFIRGIYSLISEGKFETTKVYHYDDMLRGVQSVTIIIDSDKHTEIEIKSILLPNIVQGD